jgi:hypothetical protein
MNERIRELLVQSGLLDYTKIVVPEHEKFAELIIKECADLCESFGESGDGYTCSAEILEHFGVEE